MAGEDLALKGKVTLDTTDLDKAVGRAAAIGSAIGSAIGNLAGRGIIAAKDAVVDFVGSSISAASDLNETMSKVGVLFGQQQSTIVDWSKTTATSIGASQQQALDAASNFAVFGKSAGLAGGDLTKFAEQNTQLAGDMASFFNTSPQEAIDAIGSAFRGEAEPIRKYGVLLDDASLRNEAMRLGLIKNTKTALTPQQKVLAAQGLILKQTGAAQGDFQRTSSGLANQQRILAANVDNLKAKFGAFLLPIVLKITSAFNGMLPTIMAVGKWLGAHVELVKRVAIGLGILVAACIAYNVVQAFSIAKTKEWIAQQTIVKVATAAWSAVQWLLNAALTANPLVLLGIAIAAVIGLLILAYRHSDTFRAIVQAAFGAIKTVVGAVIGFVVTVLGGLVSFFTGPVFTVIKAYWIVWSTIFKAVLGVVVGVVSRIVGAVGTFIGWLKTAWDKGIGGLVVTVATKLGAVIVWFAGLPGRILKGLGNLALTLITAGTDLIQGFINGILGMGANIINAIKKIITDHLPGFVKKALGISSPSKVFHALGRFTGQGFADGLLATGPAIDRAMGAIMALPGAGQLDVGVVTTGSRAVGQGGAAAAMAAAASRQTNIEVNAYGTEASPHRIADEIAWQARTGAVG